MPRRARELILDALPPLVARPCSRRRWTSSEAVWPPSPSPGRFWISFADLRMAVGVFLLVFLATLPVALPFAFIHEAHRALRLSNAIALVMLFLGGYYLGGHAGRHPWWSGLLMLAIGVVLVWATIVLGG